MGKPIKPKLQAYIDPSLFDAFEEYRLREGLNQSKAVEQIFRQFFKMASPTPGTADDEISLRLGKLEKQLTDLSLAFALHSHPSGIEDESADKSPEAIAQPSDGDEVDDAESAAESADESQEAIAEPSDGDEVDAAESAAESADEPQEAIAQPVAGTNQEALFNLRAKIAELASTENGAAHKLVSLKSASLIDRLKIHRNTLGRWSKLSSSRQIEKTREKDPQGIGWLRGTNGYWQAHT